MNSRLVLQPFMEAEKDRRSVVAAAMQHCWARVRVCVCVRVCVHMHACVCVSLRRKRFGLPTLPICLRIIFFFVVFVLLLFCRYVKEAAELLEAEALIMRDVSVSVALLQKAVEKERGSPASFVLFVSFLFSCQPVQLSQDNYHPLPPFA